MTTRIFPDQGKDKVELKTATQTTLHFWPLEKTAAE